MKPTTASRDAFTLVELLVVIAIIGILAALLLPAVQAARESARRTQCSNNLKQLALGMHNYHAAHNRLPWGNAYPGTPKISISWATSILPFIEQQGHFELFDFNKSMSDAANAQAISLPVYAYTCPSDPASRDPILHSRCTCCGLGSAGKCQALWYTGVMGPVKCDSCDYCPNKTADPTNYCCQGYNCGNGGDGPGMFYRTPLGVGFHEVTDGLSNTLMLGETLPTQSIHNSAFSRNMSVGYTNVPINTMATKAQTPMEGDSDSALHTKNPHGKMMGYKSQHVNGAQFAIGDGSVRMLRENIDYRLYNEMGTKAGGEAVRTE